MDRRFLGILAGLTVIFIGIFIFTGSDNKNSQNVDQSSTGQATNHRYGDGSKGVTLTEYLDFQCPVCFSYFPVVTEVMNKYSKDVYFQVRHLPLVQIHPNAFAAARAAEAAGYQGKFFEMYTQLYHPDNWNNWTRSKSPKTAFDGYAKAIKLDMAKFNQDYGSTKVNNAINADLAAFDKTGANKSTPTFFLNGKPLENSRLVGADGQPSVEAFSKVIEEAIAKQNRQPSP